MVNRKKCRGVSPGKKFLKYFLATWIILLLCSTVFAGDIGSIVPSSDNIKVYNDSTKTVTVQDYDTRSEIASVKLLTPVHNVVGAGYQKVAEFEVNAKTNYTDFLNKIYFYNQKDNMREIVRTYDLRFPVNYLTDENTYDYVCSVVKDGNGYKECTYEVSGTTQITKTRYDLLTEKDFLVGVKKVSVWTDVKVGDSVEWVPDIFGVVVNEWADWNYTNVHSWWHLDDSNYQAQDALLRNMGIITGATTGAAGKFGTDVNFKNSSDRVDLNTVAFAPDKNFTINIWIKTTNSSGNRVMSNWSASNKGFILDCGGTNNAPRFGIGDGTDTIYAASSGVANSCDTGNWRMLTGTYDGNAIKLYIDGVFVKDATQPGTVSYLAGQSNHATIGAFWGATPPTQSFTGQADEASTYLGVLDDANVSALWNGGTGVIYPFGGTPGTGQARITFNVYRKFTSTNLNAIDFDSNVNAIDLLNQTSPFSTIYQDVNTSADGNFTRAGYDSNKITFVMDSNKTITVYLTDSTAPSVGATKVTDFNVWNGFIRGTGIVSALASDSGSDINSTGCAYSNDNGATYTYGADYNGTHCYKTGVAVSNGVDYNFLFKAYDNANNVGTSTAKASYRGDVTPPTTDLNYYFPNSDNNALITLTCTDLNSGCNYTKWNIDSTSWQDYNHAFSYTGTGVHSIQYYSVDNVGNTETTITDDLNYPIILTVLYPKDEETNLQIDGNWYINITGASIESYTNLNADKNIILFPNQIYYLTIRDMNGNYFSRTFAKQYYDTNTNDTFQPYLVSTDSVYLTTLYTLDITNNNPIQNITIDVYTQSDTGYELVEQVITDASGSAQVSLIQLTNYYFDVYQGTHFWYTKERKQSINNIIYFYLVQTITDWNYDEPIFVTNSFNPSYVSLSTSSYDRIIRIKTHCNQTEINDYNLNIYQDSNHIYNFHTATNECEQINTFTIGTDFNMYDYNKPIQLILTVIYNDDLNTGVWIKDYWVASPFLGIDVFKIIRFDLRTELGCSANNDPLIPCVPLLIFFIIFLIVTCAAVSKAIGFSVKKIGMLVLLELIVFTGFGFVPLGLAAILGIVIFLSMVTTSVVGEF